MNQRRPTLQDAIEATRQNLGRFQKQPPKHRGVVGHPDGVTVTVPGKPDYVYVRIRGNAADLWEVINDSGTLNWNTPVEISLLNPEMVDEEKKVWVVSKVDRSFFTETGGWDGKANLRVHAGTHSWPDGNPGDDPVNIYARNIVPLRGFPVAGQGLRVFVAGAVLSDGFGRNTVYPGGSIDILPGDLPTDPNEVRYVAIFLTRIAGQTEQFSLRKSLGVPVLDSPTIPIPVPPEVTNDRSVCLVIVRTGQTQLTEQDFRDTRIIVGAEVDPSEPPNTGLIDGGNIIQAAAATQFTVEAGTGVIVNDVADPILPSVKIVQWGQIADIDPLNFTTQAATYVYINPAGQVLRQNTDNPSLRRSNIFLGVVFHVSDVSIIRLLVTPQVAYNTGSSLFDKLYWDGIQTKGFEAFGNANLTLGISAGVAFGPSINWHADRTNPNQRTLPTQAVLTFDRVHREGIAASAQTTVDVANYNPSGSTISAIGGGTNNSTTHRLHFFAGSLFLQYGQFVYSSLSEAISNIEIENIVYPAPLDESTIIAYIVAERGATNLSDTSQARVIPVDRSGSTGGGAGGASLWAIDAATTHIFPAGGQSVRVGFTSPTAGGELFIANQSAQPVVRMQNYNNAGNAVDAYVAGQFPEAAAATPSVYLDVSARRWNGTAYDLEGRYRIGPDNTAAGVTHQWFSVDAVNPKAAFRTGGLLVIGESVLNSNVPGANSTPGLLVRRNSQNGLLGTTVAASSSSTEAFITIEKTRGSIASPSDLVSGDRIGSLIFNGRVSGFVNTLGGVRGGYSTLAGDTGYVEITTEQGMGQAAVVRAEFNRFNLLQRTIFAAQTLPGTGLAGEMAHNTGDGKPYWWVGGAWVDMTAGGGGGTSEWTRISGTPDRVHPTTPTNSLVAVGATAQILDGVISSKMITGGTAYFTGENVAGTERLRLTESGGVSYVQIGQDAVDTGANLRFTRMQSNEPLSVFQVRSGTFGVITANATPTAGYPFTLESTSANQTGLLVRVDSPSSGSNVDALTMRSNIGTTTTGGVRMVFEHTPSGVFWRVRAAPTQFLWQVSKNSGSSYDALFIGTPGRGLDIFQRRPANGVNNLDDGIFLTQNSNAAQMHIVGHGWGPSQGILFNAYYTNEGGTGGLPGANNSRVYQASSANDRRPGLLSYWSNGGGFFGFYISTTTPTTTDQQIASWGQPLAYIRRNVDGAASISVNPGASGGSANRGLIGAHDGEGGFLVWSNRAVAGTAITILNNATDYRANDGCQIHFAGVDNAGDVGSGTVNHSGGNSDITVGSSTYRFALSGTGTLTIQRVSGTNTLKITCIIIWAD